MRSWCNALEPSLPELHAAVASARNARDHAHATVRNDVHSLHRLMVVAFIFVETGTLLPKAEWYVDHTQEDRELQNYLNNPQQPVPHDVQQFVQNHVDYVQLHVHDLYVHDLTDSEPSTSGSDSE